jgi:hypothetical protein
VRDHHAVSILLPGSRQEVAILEDARKTTFEWRLRKIINSS